VEGWWLFWFWAVKYGVVHVAKVTGLLQACKECIGGLGHFAEGVYQDVKCVKRSVAIWHTSSLEMDIVGHVVGCSMVSMLGHDVCGQVGGDMPCFVHVLTWHSMGGQCYCCSGTYK